VINKVKIIDNVGAHEADVIELEKHEEVREKEKKEKKDRQKDSRNPKT
jgi:hypothetical protein